MIEHQIILSLNLSLKFLSKSLPFMITGIILAELIIALGIMDKITFIAKPITNFAHLSNECGTSFVAAFFSPASANSMLAAFYNDGRIERKELFIAAMMNSFPSIVMHWRSMLPVLIPLLGITGMIYFSILMLVGLIKTSLLMLAGRLLLVKKEKMSIKENPEKMRPALKDALKLSLQRSRKTTKRILIVTIPTTFTVFTLHVMGVFNVLASHLNAVSAYFPVPPEGLSIIAAYFAGYIAAVTVAGNIMSAGVLTAKSIIITLLAGNVLSSLLTTIRFSTPYYIGIFGPRNGIQIMLLSTTIRTLIIIGIIFILAFIW